MEETEKNKRSEIDNTLHLGQKKLHLFENRVATKELVTIFTLCSVEFFFTPIQKI